MELVIVVLFAVAIILIAASGEKAARYVAIGFAVLAMLIQLGLFFHIGR
jgi:heme/copper-type cytochrome/quinol oxidase subunit 4